MLDYGELTVNSGSLVVQIVGLLIILLVLVVIVTVLNNHKKYMKKLNEIDEKISIIDKKMKDK
ncbi:hypothetical protein ACFVS2_24635 [Brevibacillus sp. NPDC058079]|uniref:hypothetical protein n=1 Tax=Brevibacillus sp. NPDC058079 TaxID=3346330 RepID=UPI002EB10FE7|nr:hypothetical protein [Bacillus thuringiensis]